MFVVKPLLAYKDGLLLFGVVLPFAPLLPTKTIHVTLIKMVVLCLSVVYAIVTVMCSCQDHIETDVNLKASLTKSGARAKRQAMMHGHGKMT